MVPTLVNGLLAEKRISGQTNVWVLVDGSVRLSKEPEWASDSDNGEAGEPT